MRGRRARKDYINITLKRTARFQQDYLGGACHTGYDKTFLPKVGDMFDSKKNNMNPLMYQYIKIKSVSVTWSDLKMYWCDIKPVTDVANVIPLHSKPAFPKVLFFNSFMDREIGEYGGTEQAGYYQAGGIYPPSTSQKDFQEWLRNMPRVNRVLRPGRRITVTNKEARGRWSCPGNWVLANSNFFTQNVGELTNPLRPAHADFTNSLQLPFFKYSMEQVGNYSIDSSEFDGNPFQANRQLIISFLQTVQMKFQCKLLRSDLVTTVVPIGP